ILRRLARRDALGLDAKLDPPHRQTRETTDAAAGKWRTVVAADRQWQPVFAERCFQQRPRATRIDTPHRLATQQVAAVGIADRQRIAAPAVIGAEPALVIDAPAIVRSRAIGKWRRIGRRANATSPGNDQSVAMQNLTDRACRPPTYDRIVHLGGRSRVSGAPGG